MTDFEEFIKEMQKKGTIVAGMDACMCADCVARRKKFGAKAPEIIPLESLLILYSIIIFRILRIGSISRSNFARLFCFGYAFAIFIYIVVNLSMVLGLLPIVGSPLPIMSYGGSSMLATMIGFGIVLSAKINHKQMIA